jgi:MFS transporter, DHA2 family, multidrug resistance protein
VGTAPPERAGSASGISETGAELGGALGIALLGSIGTAIYRAEGGTGETLGDALPGTIETATQAFTHGMQVAAVAAAILMAAMAVVAARLLRTRSESAPAQQVATVAATL